MKFGPVSLKDLLPVAAQIAAGIAPTRIKEFTNPLTEAEIRAIGSEAVLIATAVILFSREAVKQ